MPRMTVAGGLAIAASTAALIAAPVAGATTYNNDAPITIPTQGTANPYPSSITVSGTAGPITDVNVGFDGFTHFGPNDVSIVLVAPSRQALLLFDCVGDTTTATGVFITLDDAAAGHLPDTGALSTGTFKPTSYCGATTFPAPGPMATYGIPGPQVGGFSTFANTFNGLSAIGTWNLYVVDTSAGEIGSIPGGWSLDINPDVTPLTPGNPTNPTPTPAAPTKKCKKKKKKKGKTSAAAAKKGCKKKRKK